MRPGYISPFQRRKVKEIAELAKDNINPLTTHCHTHTGSFSFTPTDLRNYYESIDKPFDFVIGGD